MKYRLVQDEGEAVPMHSPEPNSTRTAKLHARGWGMRACSVEVYPFARNMLILRLASIKSLLSPQSGTHLAVPPLRGAANAPARQTLITHLLPACAFPILRPLELDLVLGNPASRP